MDQLPESLTKLYPFKNNFLNLGTAQMHYVDEGNGTPIIFLHGNPTWSFFYRNLILGLKENYRCIAPDHIGSGLSDKPQDYDYKLNVHTENIVQLINKLELEKFHLVVHDWGGAIGFGVAEKLNEKVDQLVILNTAAFLSKRIPLRINICRIPVFGEIAIRKFNAFAKGATIMAVENKLPQDVIQGYLYPYDSWQNRIGNFRFVQDIPATPAYPAYPIIQDIDRNLHKLSSKKKLICWGGMDWCFNDTFFEQWKTRCPEADYHYFPNAGHYVLEDAGKEILELIKDFLD